MCWTTVKSCTHRLSRFAATTRQRRIHRPTPLTRCTDRRTGQSKIGIYPWLLGCEHSPLNFLGLPIITELTCSSIVSLLGLYSMTQQLIVCPQVSTYGHFFPTLASKGIEVFTFDQRCVGVVKLDVPQIDMAKEDGDDR